MKKNHQSNKPKLIHFANKQSLKCFEGLPKSIKQLFSTELEDVIAYGLNPTIDSSPLPGKTTELKKNGSPAYRCVYVLHKEEIVILHAFKKTCEGPDRKNLNTVDQRLKNIDPDQFC